MIRWLLLGACAASLALIEGDAKACGGCFHQVNPPPEERTVVTGHRMAFSISTTQTVLWDQVQYSGNPAEFAWVLPVLPGAVIQPSRDEWFAALDAATQPVINGPVNDSSSLPQGQGCQPALTGCGSASGGADNAGAESTPNGGSPVQVLSQGVVGPYETVTLKSTDPNALTTWLTSHSYDIPASIAPTLDQYVAGGFDFIALRLRPQCGVNAMQPVRIVTPGADPSLPLRMVAAGAGAQVSVVLWIIGEGRWTTQNFPAVTLSDSQLTWDTSQSISNYEPLALSLMGQQNGTSWLTEYASSVSSSVSYPSAYTSPSTANPPLAQAYYAFCGGTAPSNGSTVVQPSPCTQASPPDAAAEAGDDAGDDAAESDADDSGGFSPPGAVGCDAYDDLSLALDGIFPDSVWLTRMRASLPVGALGTDLVLTAAEQAPISNVHYVPQTVPAPSGGSCESAAPHSDAFGTATLLTLTGAALAGMLRRRRA
jgi:hypothetical protein